MDGTAVAESRRLTITRVRKGQLRRDAVLQLVAAPGGRRRLGLVGLPALLVGVVLDGWALGAALLGVATLAQVLWWWGRTTASMRHGLDTGQTIEVGPHPDGGILLDDVSAVRLRLGPGSARVVPFRSLVTVFTGELAFILPAELLTADEVDLLEGRHLRPGDGTVEGPVLAREDVVTAEVQRDLVAAVTRTIATSADFLAVWVLAPLPVTAGALLGPSGTGPVVALVVLALLVTPSLLALPRARATIRAAYPIGAVVGVATTDRALLLALPAGTVTLPWRQYSRTRVVGRTLVLRLRGRPFRADHLDVVPLAFLDELPGAQVHGT